MLRMMAVTLAAFSMSCSLLTEVDFESNQHRCSEEAQACEPGFFCRGQPGTGFCVENHSIPEFGACSPANDGIECPTNMKCIGRRCLKPCTQPGAVDVQACGAGMYCRSYRVHTAQAIALSQGCVPHEDCTSAADCCPGGSGSCNGSDYQCATMGTVDTGGPIRACFVSCAAVFSDNAGTLERDDNCPGDGVRSVSGAAGQHACHVVGTSKSAVCVEASTISALSGRSCHPSYNPCGSGQVCFESVCRALCNDSNAQCETASSGGSVTPDIGQCCSGGAVLTGAGTGVGLCFPSGGACPQD